VNGPTREQTRWWSALLRCQAALGVEQASPTELERAIKLRSQGVSPEAAAAELWAGARPWE